MADGIFAVAPRLLTQALVLGAHRAQGRLQDAVFLAGPHQGEHALLADHGVDDDHGGDRHQRVAKQPTGARAPQRAGGAGVVVVVVSGIVGGRIASRRAKYKCLCSAMPTKVQELSREYKWKLHPTSGSCSPPGPPTGRRRGCATLVREGLAACVSVCAPMTSHYRWEGALERAEERQVVIKTTAGPSPRSRRGSGVASLRGARTAGARGGGQRYIWCLGQGHHWGLGAGDWGGFRAGSGEAPLPKATHHKQGYASCQMHGDRGALVPSPSPSRVWSPEACAGPR